MLLKSAFSLLLVFVLGSLCVLAQVPPSTGAYLGIQMVDVDTDRAARLRLTAETGVEITGVEDDGPAARAGIQAGDALLTYNGETVLGALQLIRLVHETPPGRRVRVQVSRDGKPKNLVVMPSAEPQSRAIAFPESSFVVPAGADIPFAMLIWKNGLLGIEGEGVSPQLAQYFGVTGGILIRSVGKGTAGDRAGLHAGDVLVAIGEKHIADPRDLNSFCRNLRDDTRVIGLSVVRNKKQVNLQAKLAASE